MERWYSAFSAIGLTCLLLGNQLNHWQQIKSFHFFDRSILHAPYPSSTPEFNLNHFEIRSCKLLQYIDIHTLYKSKIIRGRGCQTVICHCFRCVTDHSYLHCYFSWWLTAVSICVSHFSALGQLSLELLCKEYLG